MSRKSGTVGKFGVAAVLVVAVLLGLPAAGAADDHEGPRLRVLGFYDLDYSAVDAKGRRVTSEFSQGQLVFHAISSMTDRTSFFGELSLSPGSPYAVNVERAIFKVELSNLVNLSMGRYHTPINWWNSAFHHGLWLQTTIRRPEMTQFGTKFLPVHFVGLLGQGGVDAGGFSIDYEGGIGNGRSSGVSGAGDAGDANNNRALLAHVFLQPDAEYHLRAGGSWYKDRIDRNDTAGMALPSVREWIASAYVVYTKETPEVLSEISWVNHRNEGESPSYLSRAWYVQGAWRLPVARGMLKPYARFEEMNIEHGDPIFHAEASTAAGSPTGRDILNPAHDGAKVSVPYLRRYTVGVRADVSSFAALKLEYRRERNESPIHVNGAYTQLSLVF